MSALVAAFNILMNLKAKTATISRPGTASTGTIRLASSNYFRNLEVANQITSKGREFVISKVDLDAITFPAPRRGDQLVDSVMGTMTITEPFEMFGLGGEILGYRVKVG